MKLADSTYTSAASEVIQSLDFDLPDESHASEPPEARGLRRDEVRLMVSRPGGELEHARFRDLADFLKAGDVLLTNTSPTMKASVPATRGDGSLAELHLSTRLPAGLWTVEVRAKTPSGAEPLLDAGVGEEITLFEGASATLLSPYARTSAGVRLWVASLRLPSPVADFLDRNGSPIRYGYVGEEWPSDYYQTVFADAAGHGSSNRSTGSAEMPSAGRPFTADLVARLVLRGVQVAPLVLHTGVSSLESDEPPYEEYYEVPGHAARAVNRAKRDGGRAVAVGTTAVRSIETVADERGFVGSGRGWTDLVITPERGVRVVDGVITGLHEPRSSHLAMLEAISTRDDLKTAYEEAIRESYLWHEFGDSHLILRR